MTKLPVALQLYSVRDAMEKDFAGTIEAVAKMGYQGVEFAGVFGKSAEEVKNICKNAGINPISAHVPYDDMKKDAKSGSYNPFNLMFPEGIPEKDREMIKGAFVHSLAAIEMAADLIECSDESLKGIIYNIIYCGMKRKSDEITDKIITAVK